MHRSPLILARDSLTISPQANEIRAGIVHHFPRMLNNPRAAARRARQGEQDRARQRQDRQRRRGRQAVGRTAVRSAATPEAAAQPDDDEEAFDWPASDEEAQAAGVVQEGEQDEQALAAQLEWENEERFRQGNYNVAPRSNGVVLRLRPAHASGSDLRLRGGGQEGEVVETKSEAKQDPLDIGDQELVIETM